MQRQPSAGSSRPSTGAQVNKYSFSECEVGSDQMKLMYNFYSVLDSIHTEDTLSRHAFGFNATKRKNVLYITESKVITAVGNVVIFIDLKTGKQEYLSGLTGSGIGAIAVLLLYRMLKKGC